MLLFPFFAFAHGEEVLFPLLMQFVFIFIFFIWVVFVKGRITDKLILGASYVIALTIILFATRDVPYRQNRTALDSILIFGPAATLLITFIILRFKRKKKVE